MNSAAPDPNSWEGLQSGIEFKLLKDFPITLRRLRHYAWASGDYNTIHFSKEIALQNGLDDSIAHGLLQLGLMNASLEELLDQIRTDVGVNCVLRTLDTKFVGMALVGDSLSISAKIASTSETSFTLHVFVFRNGDRKLLTCTGSAFIESTL
jgi:acyl dehydratase